MNIETNEGRIIIAEHHSGQEYLVLARDFLGCIVMGIGLLLVVQYGLPWYLDKPATDLDLWSVVQVIGGMDLFLAACAALAAPFDTGLEFVFDVATKSCSYSRHLRLRRSNIDLRRTRETIAFTEISGIGVRESR
ncbi:MAG: hypothetical protein RL291_1958, partial [Pseudomonadota bacterium]